MYEMESLCEKIKDFSLLDGLDHGEIIFLLEYLNAHLVTLEKGRLIYPSSKPIDSFVLLLQGSLELIQYDYWGNRSLILTQGEGSCVGLACTLFDNWVPEASIVARSKCELLYFEARKLRESACLIIPACASLKMNIAKQLATKNAALLNKLSLIHCRTTREKVSLFLSQTAVWHQSNHFDIGFSRQEMADFLSVDRCALSKELARMKQDGLIDYHRNHFELKQRSVP